MEIPKEFLPKDYQEPDSDISNYLEFKVGDNPIRILSKCFPGWEWWQDQQGHVLSGPKTGCKVNRVRALSEIPKSVQENPNFQKRFFWAFVVLNRNTNRIQLVRIHQKSIRKKIKFYKNNPNWGQPYSYDLVISREGQGKHDTKYDVMPLPKEPLSEDEMTMIRKTSFDIEAYFRNEDPFEAGHEKEQAQEPNTNGRVRPPVQSNGVPLPR